MPVFKISKDSLMLNLFTGGNSPYRQTIVMAAAPLPHFTGGASKKAHSLLCRKNAIARENYSKQ